MCGRFYVDDTTMQDIKRIVKQVQAGLNDNKIGEIYPTNSVPVIAAQGNVLTAVVKSWGYKHFRGKGVIFNARSETVLEKNMFKSGVRERRCVVPARYFYEWDHQKTKIAFSRADQQPLYFAGFYNNSEEDPRFVILTTAANVSIQDVHGRMPLILDPAELDPWLLGNQEYEFLLRKTPTALQRQESQKAEEPVNSR